MRIDRVTDRPDVVIDGVPWVLTSLQDVELMQKRAGLAGIEIRIDLEARRKAMKASGRKGGERGAVYREYTAPIMTYQNIRRQITRRFAFLRA